MTADQLLAWVDKQLLDYAPTDDVGEMRNRFSRVLTNHGKHAVFGFTIPKELVDVVERPIADRFAASLANWQQFLSTIDGGPEYFQRSLEAHGLVPPPTRALVTDPAVDKAVAKLRERLADITAATESWRERGWLDGEQQFAYAIAPPDPELADLLARTKASDGFELPAQLEALFTRIGGLWVGAVGPGEVGGQREFDPSADDFVIAPIENLLDASGQRGTILLNQDVDYFRWVEMDDETGAITSSNKLDRDKRQLASSLVEYLELLADTYGRP